jgi:hypothetical protein
MSLTAVNPEGPAAAPGGSAFDTAMTLAYYPGPLGGATLSRDDLGQLQSAVDTFADAYTSGVDASKDSAALNALRAALSDLDLQIWSESHVADPSAVASLKGAVEAFAANYTGNSDTGKDTLAWKALGTALTGFAASLHAPGAPAPAATDLMGAGPDAPLPMILPAFTPGVGMMIEPLLDGDPLPPADVARLKSAVDTFADAYTSGADASKDSAALDAFQTSLGSLIESHWRAVPMSDPAAMASATSTPDTTPIHAQAPAPAPRPAPTQAPALPSDWFGPGSQVFRVSPPGPASAALRPTPQS